MEFLYLFFIISSKKKDKKKRMNLHSVNEEFGKNYEIITIASIGKDLYSRISFLLRNNYLIKKTFE